MKVEFLIFNPAFFLFSGRFVVGLYKEKEEKWNERKLALVIAAAMAG